MLGTINNIRSYNPNQRIFIIAGAKHFTNILYQDSLKEQPYIMLKATYEPTEQDEQDYRKKSQGW